MLTGDVPRYVFGVSGLNPQVLHARKFLGYILRASDQRARASMRVQATGVFVSYVTATV